LDIKITFDLLFWSILYYNNCVEIKKLFIKRFLDIINFISIEKQIPDNLFTSKIYSRIKNVTSTEI
jgi:hypothetical protein